MHAENYGIPSKGVLRFIAPWENPIKILLTIKRPRHSYIRCHQKMPIVFDYSSAHNHYYVNVMRNCEFPWVKVF